MPYIKPEERAALKPAIEVLANIATTPGQWNYAITAFLHCVIQNYSTSAQPNYALLNALIGVLECAKMELYRMVAAPYENRKQAENGPVSSLDA